MTLFRMGFVAALTLSLACAQTGGKGKSLGNNTAPVASPSRAQMSVDDVTRLLDAGLSVEVVISKLRAQGCAYDLTADQLIALKNKGVPQAVIAALLDPTAAPAARIPESRPTAETAAKPEPAARSEFQEPGVYMRKAGKWLEVLPEVVNWKTGGVLKTIGTAGIVKGDLNGNIEGPNSRNTAKSPLEFVIYTPEGVAITEYQLLRLRVNRDYREFRTITGGIMHVKGGATRDLVPFEHKKLAPRTYEVVFPATMSSGEYGFLPPGAMTSSNSAASLGKLYSFRMLE